MSYKALHRKLKIKQNTRATKKGGWWKTQVLRKGQQFL